MSRLSPMYPRAAIDVGKRLQLLPEDGSVPHMPGWQWVHTPGHTPGHVSFFREADRTLIVGDAFCTTRQESLIDAMTQRYEIHGPPMYFTTDWKAARSSVERLDALHPMVAAPSHGRPVSGTRLAHDLHRLARDFDQLAVPRDGRYVRSPVVTNELGAVIRIPPRVPDLMPKVLTAVALGAGVAALVVTLRNRDQRR
jgi:glyoxylase-like metal-dependent hydrolase (beta-lactamase superfamily II)